MFKNVSRTASVIALIAILLVACTPRTSRKHPGPCAGNFGPRVPATKRPPPLPKAALLLPEPIGAPAPKSSSSPADQRVVALRPSSITALSPRPQIRARMCNTCGPTGILPR